MDVDAEDFTSEIDVWLLLIFIVSLLGAVATAAYVQQKGDGKHS